LLRKIVAALVLVLLAVMMVAFAVANPQIVTVSLDLVGSNESITSVTLPLFALIIFSASIGVVMGGLAAWARQGKCPGTARRLERQVQALRKKITDHKIVLTKFPAG